MNRAERVLEAAGNRLHRVAFTTLLPLPSLRMLPGETKATPGGLPPRKLTGQGVCRLSGLRFAIKTPGTQGREQLELWAQGRRPTLERPDGPGQRAE